MNDFWVNHIVWHILYHIPGRAEIIENILLQEKERNILFSMELNKLDKASFCSRFLINIWHPRNFLYTSGLRVLGNACPRGYAQINLKKKYLRPTHWFKITKIWEPSREIYFQFMVHGISTRNTGARGKNNTIDRGNLGAGSSYWGAELGVPRSLFHDIPVHVPSSKFTIYRVPRSGTEGNQKWDDWIKYGNWRNEAKNET